MNEAMESVCVKENDDETLRLGRTPVRPRCKDRGDDNVTPVPAFVPGDFTVVLGDIMPTYVMEELEEEFAKFGGISEAVSGFLSAIHWVEYEVQGVDDLLEGLWRLRGAVMVAAVVG